MEKKYYTAMNEAVFYYCIGNDLKKVKIFIEQVIKQKINKIEMKNPKLLKDYMNTKDRTLDYLVLTDYGYVNVEINNYYEDWRINRDITYACKVLTNSITKENEYKSIPKVIQININRMGKNKDGIEIYKFNGTNNSKGFPKTISDIIEIYMVNIDYYREMVYNKNNKFINENYMICVMDLQPSDIDNIKEGNGLLMEYKKDLEKINNDEDFVNWISSEKEAEMFERTRLLIAEEKGSIESKKEIAKKLLNEGLDINVISKVTELSNDEINKL